MFSFSYFFFRYFQSYGGRHRCLAFVFSFIAVISNQYAIRYPITPVEPKTPSVEGYKKPASKSTTTKKLKVVEQDIYVKTILGSGDELAGSVRIPEKIEFKHYKNGLIFKKNLLIEDISSIEIQSFRKKLLWKKEKISFYEFKPSKVKIITKSKNEFIIDYLFKFLHKFSIQTYDGITTLYSFFADEFHQNKGWSEVESKEISYHDNKPHPKSVKKIIFFLPKENSE